jgi:phosphoribosylformylglycinamidine cyclo-ligase
MYRTFNCGVGMVLAVASSDAEQALTILEENGESPWVIGHIASATDGEEQVELQGL